MYDAVLLPTDGSEHARRATEHGVYIARAHDATIHLLHVVEPIRIRDAPTRHELRAARAERGQQLLESVRAGIEGVEVAEDYVAYGEPCEVVREYVRDRDVDLVVVGRWGRAGRETGLGSTSNCLLRVLDIPVLTVGDAAEVREIG